MKYLNFVRGVSSNLPGKVGVILTTSSFIAFVLFETAHTLGLMHNAYVGLISYLLFPALFLVGLVFIPLGWYIYQKSSGKSTRELLSETFVPEDLISRPTGARLFQTIAILTLLNILFLGVVTVRMLHFMDLPHFCGTACHTVMNPEWTTYQQSPHARVQCVECHVGEGVDALVKAKLNGVRQMYLAAFNLHNRPIPTPVHQLRPARETCEKCHWPEKFYGKKLITHTHYTQDSVSTPYYNTLLLKIDMGDVNSEGIHWHIGKVEKVRYASLDDKQEEIIWVDVLQEDNTFKRYKNTVLIKDTVYSEIRTMDCVDCHNRATHIYKDPDKAVDDLLATGLLDRSLPFIKKTAFGVITKKYPSQQSAEMNIETGFLNYYLKNYPDLFNSKRKEIDDAVSALQSLYNANVFHDMNIPWNNYKSHLDHKNNEGCFRCHNAYMVADDQSTISNECTDCHSILAFEEPNSIRYLEPVSDKERGFKEMQYLQQDALKTMNAASK